MATKFEAFKGRGSGDYRTSHDFEDIIYVLDNRINIVKEILSSDENVRTFIQNEFMAVYNNPHATEIISAQIHPLAVEYRFPIVLEKIKKIISQ